MVIFTWSSYLRSRVICNINDLYKLDNTQPLITEIFREGKFTVYKTGKNLSPITIDHVLEQKCVKRYDRIIGLTGNSGYL